MRRTRNVEAFFGPLPSVSEPFCNPAFIDWMTRVP